jgi:hypothetical protein
MPLGRDTFTTPSGGSASSQSLSAPRASSAVTENGKMLSGASSVRSSTCSMA